MLAGRGGPAVYHALVISFDYCSAILWHLSHQAAASSTMPVSIDKDDVYLGVWTNWANGAVRGSTLTMHRADGALLTAFIAIFVGYAGARAWRILCFMTHLALSKDLSQDALYHQRQAILRNTPSADAAVWDLILAAWAWRRLMHRDVLKRLLPLIILGLSVSVAIAAAGVLSSQLSNSMVSDDMTS